MKKLLFRIIIGICSLFGAEIFGQSNDSNTINPIEKSVKLDLTSLLDQSVMLEYETPIGKQSSYSFSTGIKWYPQSSNLETGTTRKVSTNITKRESTTMFIFFNLSGNSSTKVGKPIVTTHSEFIPTQSIPFQHSIRYYFNPTNKSRFYMNGKLLSSINSGYTIEYKNTKTILDKEEEHNYSSWIASSSTITTTTQIIDTKTISKSSNLSAGLGVALGVNSYISKKMVIDLSGEAGFNVTNGHSDYNNSMLGMSYAKLKMLVGFRFSNKNKRFITL